MEIVRHRFRHTLKPIGFSIFCFALISSLFVIAYIVVDYQGYVKDYRTRQAQEIITIHQKAESTLEQLGKMLSLLESRIYNVQGNLSRIQKILTSIHQLQTNQSLPEFQKISFYKLTSPQMVITRYGEVPLETNKVQMERIIPKGREPIFSVGDKGLLGRMAILGFEGTVEGILEIQISLIEFWKILGTYETVGFNQAFVGSTDQNQEAEPFFHIQENIPESFWVYGLAHRSTYVGFALYLLFSLILLGLCLYSLNTYFQRSFGKKGAILEEALLESEEREKTLREELWVHQQDTQSHQTSCQRQRKLQTEIKTKRHEYGRYLVQSLDILKQSYTSPLSTLTEADRADIVNLCLRQAKPLSIGLWEPANKEEVDLGEIIHTIPLLFAERIQASSIMIEIDIPSEITPILRGEVVFMELLLINAIGKLIYRVPKKGKVFISLEEENGAFHLKIQDNGYPMAGTTANLVKNSFDFFMEDGTFLQVCQENGIIYKTSTGKNGGMNVTHIMLPISRISQEEIINSNVVQLFR